MTALAILDASLPSQLRENPEALGGLELRWMGDDAAQFLAAIKRAAPDVLVVNLERVPGDPAEWLQRALEESGATLALCIYTFLPKRDLDALGDERFRPIKGPVSLHRLRAQMMSLIVAELLRGARSEGALPARPMPRPNAPGAGTPARGVTPPPRALSRPAFAAVSSEGAPHPAATSAVLEAEAGVVRAPKYTPSQLGKLLEMRSALQCECPNHVAELVQSLRAFEEYARTCANRDDQDAAVHRSLYRLTAHARAVMEQALDRLVEHERIAL